MIRVKCRRYLMTYIIWLFVDETESIPFPMLSKTSSGLSYFADGKFISSAEFVELLWEDFSDDTKEDLIFNGFDVYNLIRHKTGEFYL